MKDSIKIALNLLCVFMCLLCVAVCGSVLVELDSVRGTLEEVRKEAINAAETAEETEYSQMIKAENEGMKAADAR